MGIDEEEQNAIFRIVSGILHLGNINFTATYGDTSVLQDKTSLSYAAEMLGTNPAQGFDWASYFHR